MISEFLFLFFTPDFLIYSSPVGVGVSSDILPGTDTEPVHENVTEAIAVVPDLQSQVIEGQGVGSQEVVGALQHHDTVSPGVTPELLSADPQVREQEIEAPEQETEVRQVPSSLVFSVVS
jgi:hypothetical protein